MHITVKFIWYDLWMGLFIDFKKKTIYIGILPTIMIIIHWNVWYFIRTTKKGDVKYIYPNMNWLINLLKKTDCDKTVT